MKAPVCKPPVLATSSTWTPPNLRGISRTAPYFTNNSAATLEEMLEHYKQFFKRVQVQTPAAPLLTTQPGVTHLRKL